MVICQPRLDYKEVRTIGLVRRCAYTQSVIGQLKKMNTHDSFTVHVFTLRIPRSSLWFDCLQSVILSQVPSIMYVLRHVPLQRTVVWVQVAVLSVLVGAAWPQEGHWQWVVPQQTSPVGRVQVGGRHP